MSGARVRTADWVRQWIRMLDARHPGWRADYDPESFELAVEDVHGGEPERELDPVAAEILGEFTERQDEEAASLAETPAFRAALEEFADAFRARHGSSRTDPALRGRRAEALRAVVQAVMEPLLDRFVRMARALEMRERRRSKRHPALPDAGLVAGDEAGPDVESLAREAAGRVARRLREELSPGALEGVRRLLLEPGDLGASEAARLSGVSPATMTRALQRVRSVAAEELRGCPESALKPFLRALLG